MECRGHSPVLSQEAEKMKRVLTALFACLIFTPSVYAKKPDINWTDPGTLNLNEHAEYCEYKCSAPDQFSFHAHTHKSNLVELLLLIDDEVMPVWPAYSRPTNSQTENPTGHWCGTFAAGRGKNWTLVWVLESTKGKGRIIDSVEADSGFCAPSP